MDFSFKAHVACEEEFDVGKAKAGIHLALNKTKDYAFLSAAEPRPLDTDGANWEMSQSCVILNLDELIELISKLQDMEKLMKVNKVNKWLEESL